MSRLVKSSILLLPLLLGACTETAFMDAMGAGKYQPDETQVPQGQKLAVPPDFNLRAPADGAAPQAADAANPAPAPAPAAPAQTAAATPATPAAPVALPQGNAPLTDAQRLELAYQKYGISKTNPDGTPKTTAQLDEELKAAVLAEKRKTNPNYGTIWNLGNIFSD